MGRYLAHRIEGGHLDYDAVVRLWGDYKDEIDTTLTDEGYGYLIVKENELTIKSKRITIADNIINIC